MTATKRILAFSIVVLLLISCQSAEKAKYLREVEKSKEFVQRRFNDMNIQSNKRIEILPRLSALELPGSESAIENALSELTKSANEVNSLKLKDNAIINSHLDQPTLDKYIRLQEKMTSEVSMLDSLVNKKGTMNLPGSGELLSQLKKVTKRLSIDARKFSSQLERHNESYPDHTIPLKYSIDNSILGKVDD